MAQYLYDSAISKATWFVQVPSVTIDVEISFDSLVFVDEKKEWSRPKNEIGPMVRWTADVIYAPDRETLTFGKDGPTDKVNSPLFYLVSGWWCEKFNSLVKHLENLTFSSIKRGMALDWKFDVKAETNFAKIVENEDGDVKQALWIATVSEFCGKLTTDHLSSRSGSKMHQFCPPFKSLMGIFDFPEYKFAKSSLVRPWLANYSALDENPSLEFSVLAAVVGWFWCLCGPRFPVFVATLTGRKSENLQEFGYECAATQVFLPIKGDEFETQPDLKKDLLLSTAVLILSEEEREPMTELDNFSIKRPSVKDTSVVVVLITEGENVVGMVSRQPEMELPRSKRIFLNASPFYLAPVWVKNFVDRNTTFKVSEWWHRFVSFNVPRRLSVVVYSQECSVLASDYAGFQDLDVSESDVYVIVFPDFVAKLLGEFETKVILLVDVHEDVLSSQLFEACGSSISTILSFSKPEFDLLDYPFRTTADKIMNIAQVANNNSSTAYSGLFIVLVSRSMDGQLEFRDSRMLFAISSDFRPYSSWTTIDRLFLKVLELLDSKWFNAIPKFPLINYFSKKKAITPDLYAASLFMFPLLANGRFQLLQAAEDKLAKDFSTVMNLRDSSAVSWLENGIKNSGFFKTLLDEFSSSDRVGVDDVKKAVYKSNRAVLAFNAWFFTVLQQYHSAVGLGSLDINCETALIWAVSALIPLDLFDENLVMVSSHNLLFSHQLESPNASSSTDPKIVSQQTAINNGGVTRASVLGMDNERYRRERSGFFAFQKKIWTWLKRDKTHVQFYQEADSLEAVGLHGVPGNANGIIEDSIKKTKTNQSMAALIDTASKKIGNPGFSTFTLVDAGANQYLFVSQGPTNTLENQGVKTVLSGNLMSSIYDAGNCLYVNVHIPFDADPNRPRSFVAVLEYFAAFASSAKLPVVVGGDFNLDVEEAKNLPFGWKMAGVQPGLQNKRYSRSVVKNFQSSSILDFKGSSNDNFPVLVPVSTDKRLDFIVYFNPMGADYVLSEAMGVSEYMYLVDMLVSNACGVWSCSHKTGKGHAYDWKMMSEIVSHSVRICENEIKPFNIKASWKALLEKQITRKFSDHNPVHAGFIVKKASKATPASSPAPSPASSPS